MVISFIYAIAAAAPMLLAAAPAKAVSWYLYFDVGRSFSIAPLVGSADSLPRWLLVLAYLFCLAGCFSDIRKGQRLISGFVMAALFLVTVPILLNMFWKLFAYPAPVAGVPGWFKLAVIVFYGNFLYLGLREIAVQAFGRRWKIYAHALGCPMATKVRYLR